MWHSKNTKRVTGRNFTFHRCSGLCPSTDWRLNKVREDKIIYLPKQKQKKHQVLLTFLSLCSCSALCFCWGCDLLVCLQTDTEQCSLNEQNKTPQQPSLPPQPRLSHCWSRRVISFSRRMYPPSPPPLAPSDHSKSQPGLFVTSKLKRPESSLNASHN